MLDLPPALLRSRCRNPAFRPRRQRLHMAQPPLTRQISALEEELGFRLFDRSSRAVTLTAEGSLFLPYARGLLDQLERTAGFARKLAQGLAGHLTLGYASSIALSDLFTEAIRLFRERHPEVQLELLEGASAAQWAQIAEGGIDGAGAPAAAGRPGWHRGAGPGRRAAGGGRAQRRSAGAARADRPVRSA